MDRGNSSSPELWKYIMNYNQIINTGITLQKFAMIDMFERSIGNNESADKIRSVLSEPERAYAYKTPDIYGALEASLEVVEIADLFQQRLGFPSEYAHYAAVRFVVLCMGTYPQELGTWITGSVKASDDLEVLERFRALIASAISNVIDGVEDNEYTALIFSIDNYAEILAGLASGQHS
jgi:hypothetical protein